MMMRLICLLSVFGLAQTGMCASKQIRNLEFAVVNGHSLTLDLYLPDKGKNPPLLLWIHGGGWHSGSKSKCPISWVTEDGFAVASISYRLTDKAIFPAQIHDCKAAVRLLRANRSKYGYSTDKVGIAGSSAGGMLAALMGTSGDVEALEGTVGGNKKQSSRVDAVIDFYGATDFVLRSKTQPKRANTPGSVVFKLLGGGADRKVELARLASAAFHVSRDDPPMLVFHGDKDKTVLPDQSLRIQEAYKSARLPLDLNILKGAGHGGKQFFSKKNKKKMVSFLSKHLK